MHEKSIPYVHEMMGRAENNNRIILNNMRALLQAANMTRGYWTFAGKVVCYQYNRCCKTTDHKSPWELLYSRKPNLGFLMVFGVFGYAYVPPEKRRKLEATCVPVRFRGQCWIYRAKHGFEPCVLHSFILL